MSSGKTPRHSQDARLRLESLENRTVLSLLGPLPAPDVITAAAASVLESGVGTQIVAEPAEHAAPVMEVIQPITAPVEQLTQPVIDTIMPPTAQVVETVAATVLPPVQEALTPIQPVVDPVLEPVLQPVGEVVEQTPILNEVVETLPIVQDAVEQAPVIGDVVEQLPESGLIETVVGELPTVGGDSVLDFGGVFQQLPDLAASQGMAGTAPGAFALPDGMVPGEGADRTASELAARLGTEDAAALLGAENEGDDGLGGQGVASEAEAVEAILLPGIELAATAGPTIEAGPGLAGDQGEIAPRSADLVVAGAPGGGALDLAIRQFLDQLDDMGRDLAQVLAQNGLLPWLIALGAGAAGMELARRRLRRPQRVPVAAGFSAADTLSWVPGFPHPLRPEDA